jgi:hypothetical protein
MPRITRRSFVGAAVGGSVLTLDYVLPTGVALLTPAQARVKGVPLRTLSATQAHQLERLGDALVPGSAALGLTHFIDHQLAVDPNSALLIAKYFEVTPPYLDFYAAGLKATTAMATKDHGGAIEDQDRNALKPLVTAMSQPDTLFGEFPIFLFYLCLRSDAIDVAYGTPKGFERLNLPYMQHILPPERWDA